MSVNTRSVTRGRWKTGRLLVLPTIALLCVFFIYPIGNIAWRSFSEPTLGFDNYVKLFEASSTLKVLIRTFTVALAVTFATLIIAYPYAYAMTRASDSGRRLLMLVVLIPFWTSLVARTFAWYVLEQSGGVINRFFEFFGADVVLLQTTPGVSVAMIQVLLPFMVLPLYSGLSGIDHNLLSASRTLGASPFQTFRRIYLPLSVPAMISGGSLVFIVSLGFYVTPAVLGGPNQALISQVIAIRVNRLLDFAGAGALAVILLVLTLIVLWILSKIGTLSSAAGGK